jgi:hypothetical protein
MKVIRPLLLLFIAGCFSSGCNTPNADFGTTTDAVSYGAVVIPMSIVAVPVALVEWTGWKIITSGPKRKVYASGGVSVSDFQRAIVNVEGGQCLPELQTEPDGSMLFKYSGKKAIYYGRFKGNHAIEY